jgi:hypothetical protein
MQIGAVQFGSHPAIPCTKGPLFVPISFTRSKMATAEPAV